MVKYVTKKSYHKAKEILSLIRFSPFDIDSVEGRSKERYRRIILSSGTSFISKGVVSLVGLVSVPLTINYFGNENYGLWIVVSSLVAWLQLSDFGIGNGITNIVAKSYGRNDLLAAKSAVYSSFAVLFAIVIVLFFPMIFVVNILPWNQILKITNASTLDTAKSCFNIVSGFFLFSIPFSIFSRVLVAYQLGYLVSLFQIGSSLLCFGGLLLCLHFKLNLIWFAGFTSFSGLLVNIIMMLFVKNKYDIKFTDFSLFSRKSLKSIYKIGFPFFLFQIEGLIINNLTSVIITRKMNLEAVADFGVYNKLYLLFFFVGTSIAVPFYPAIREAFERKDYSWVKKSILRVVFLRLLAVCAVSLPFIFFGNSIVSLWTSGAIEHMSYFGWIMLSLCLVFISVASTLSEVMFYSDVIWIQVFITMITAVLMMVSMNLLIPAIGFIGVYAAFILSNLHSMAWGLIAVRKLLFHNRR